MTSREFKKKLQKLESERHIQEENMMLDIIACEEAFNYFIKSLFSLYRKEVRFNSTVNRQYRILNKETSKKIKVPYANRSTEIFEKMVDFDMDFKNRKKYLFDEVNYK